MADIITNPTYEDIVKRDLDKFDPGNVEEKTQADYDVHAIVSLFEQIKVDWAAAEVIYKGQNDDLKRREKLVTDAIAVEPEPTTYKTCDNCAKLFDLLKTFDTNLKTTISG